MQKSDLRKLLETKVAMRSFFEVLIEVFPSGK